MRARSIAVVATVAVAGASVGIVPGSAAAKTKRTAIACTVYLTEQSGNVLKGADKGPMSCSSPLGDGTQSDTFTMKFNKAKTGGTGLVKFKDQFKGGTVSGTWKLTFKISGPAVSIAYHVTYTGGTGKFTGITGTGKGAGGLSSMTTGSFQYAVNAVVPASTAHAAKPKVVGHMYSQSNGLTGNEIVIWNRYSNGKVKLGGTVSTGGVGAAQQQPGCTATCPQLDTDFEVLLTPDHTLLFAVNAGSNTISAFRVAANGSLTLAGTVSSNGAFPFSLTSHGSELYVLNADSTSIAGFTFNSTGALTPIPGSVQKLTKDAMPGLSRQIGFDNTGKLLIVTLLMPSEIDTFAVGASGAAGPASEVASTTPFPFGFVFDKANQLVMSQVSSLTAEGSTATYSVTASGSARPDRHEAVARSASLLGPGLTEPEVRVRGQHGQRCSPGSDHCLDKLERVRNADVPGREPPPEARAPEDGRVHHARREVPVRGGASLHLVRRSGYRQLPRRVPDRQQRRPGADRVHVDLRSPLGTDGLVGF